VSVYRFRDDLIAEVSFHPGDQYALDGYWQARNKEPVHPRGIPR